jgi:hypothetical protein
LRVAAAARPTAVKAARLGGGGGASPAKGDAGAAVVSLASGYMDAACCLYHGSCVMRRRLEGLVVPAVLGAARAAPPVDNGWRDERGNQAFLPAGRCAWRAL